MEISEAVQLKHEAEKQILAIILKLQEQLDRKVETVHIERHHGDYTPTGIDITINL